MSIGMVTNYFNEELIMEGFVRQHREIFDEVICIDHGSTDASTAIIRELAPNWMVVNTQLPEFDAHLNDREIMDYETRLRTEWKICLNTTEWLWDSDLINKLNNLKHLALGMKSYIITGENKGYLDNFSTFSCRRWRFIHKATHGHYHLGRHGVDLPYICDGDSRLLWFGWHPWPECMERKLQIQTKIPMSDKIQKRGFQHIQTKESLEKLYKDELEYSENLLEDPYYRKNYEYYNRHHHRNT